MDIETGDRVLIRHGDIVGSGGYGVVVEVRPSSNWLYPDGMVYVKREDGTGTGIYSPEHLTAVVTVPKHRSRRNGARP